MKYPPAIALQVERAREAIAAIAADCDAIYASDALQELGVRVIRAIEQISAEATIERVIADRRKRHVR